APAPPPAPDPSGRTSRPPASSATHRTSLILRSGPREAAQHRRLVSEARRAAPAGTGSRRAMPASGASNRPRAAAGLKSVEVRPDRIDRVGVGGSAIGAIALHACEAEGDAAGVLAAALDLVEGDL